MQSPDAAKKKSKADFKKATKITEEERKRLATKISEHENIQHKMGQLCLEKEIRIKEINDSFAAQFNPLYQQAVAASEKKNDALRDLSEKYGDGRIDVVTGNITRPEPLVE